MTERSSTRWTFAALAFLSFFLLRDTLFLGRSFFERDLLHTYFPWIQAFVRSIHEGSLPLRDTTTGFGQPILGNPSSQVLYPPTWLHLILAPDRALSLIVLFHFIVGSTGAGALCARFSESRIAHFLAGAFWISSGPFLSAVNLWHHFAGAAWLPWVIWAFDGLIRNPDRARALLLGALLGVQILAGSADLCAMTVLLCGLRAATLLRTSLPGTLGRRAALLAGAAVIASFLGAGVWMPALDIVRGAIRTTQSVEMRTQWSLHPVAAVEMALPLQAGTLPLSSEVAAQWNEGQPPFLKSIFLGTLVLPLALSGLLNVRVARSDRLFLGLMTLGSGLVALGRLTPFYELTVTLLPPLAIFRYPSKMLLPLSLSAVLLAAIGVAALDQVRARRAALAISLFSLLAHAGVLANASRLATALLDPFRPALMAEMLGKTEQGLVASSVAIAVFVCALASNHARAIHAGLACSLIATALANQDINPTVEQKVLRFRPGHVSLLETTEPSRVHAFDYLHYPARSGQIFNRGSLIVPDKVQGLAPAEAFIVVVRSALMPPTGGSWGVEYAWDFDPVGLFDRALREMTLHIRNVEGQPAFLRMLQVANVSRVVALHQSGFEQLTLEHAVPLPLPEPLYIYRVPDFLPRAYAVSGTRVLSIPDAERTLIDPTFDPRVEVALGDGVPLAVSPSFAATVKVSERTSNRISLEATLNEGGFVVLVDGFLPGWRAVVDGADVPVHRANALFLAARVPAGRHEVVFTYSPAPARIGIVMTLMTGLVLVSALLLRSSLRPSI